MAPSIRAFLLAACGGLVPGCGDPAPPRSVVLVTLDTTRLDALGVYGGAPGVTPRLDALAQRSVRYEWARAVAPLTLPSHASMFTGLYPPRHTARGNAPSVLPGDAVTVAERARAAGFETAGFVASLALDRSLGIAQGFETWSQPARPSETGVTDRPGFDVVADAVRWLGARDAARPYFLWVHLFDPHAPHAPPAAFAGAGSDYLGEVAAMDAAVGSLLDALDERVFVAIVADHGEGLMDHGERTHGLLCWDSTLRVPLLLRYSEGYRAGEVSDDVVSVVDLGPTLLEAMDLAPEEGIDGQSLYRRSTPADRGVYFESYDGWRRFGWSPLVGWADRSGKYVRGSREQLFDTTAAPGELDDLLEGGAPLPARYIEALARIAGLPSLETTEYRAVDAEILEEMARLGYGASHRRTPAYPGPLDDVGRLDPRDRFGAYADFQHARDFVRAGDHGAAIPILEGLCHQNPSNPSAHDWLARALMGRGDFERAVQVLRARLVLPPEQVETHRDLATCFEQLGDAERRSYHGIRALELIVEAQERHGEVEEAREGRALLERMRAEAGTDP